jgi:predicted NAD/FAD-binding protein
MTLSENKNIAVIGSGVAGISAAWLLGQKHRVTLFEKNPKIGGHTNTIEIREGEDAGTNVDTGFIVCNDRTYENFHKLLQQLGCGVRNADMSFAYHDESSRLQYAGTNLNGLFAQRTNFFKISFWILLSQILKFMKCGRTALNSNIEIKGTLGEFLQRNRIHEVAIQHYVLPMGAAIWSAPRAKILDFPATSFLHFFENHGLLTVTDMPQWQTVIGGSHSYLKAFQEKFSGEIFRSQAVKSLRRHETKVEIYLADASVQIFDSVVIAAHADEALKLLEDPSEDERRLLGPWRYQLNQTVLHSDQKFLPLERRAWASWNYLREKNSDEDGSVTVTYHMNRLQGLKSKRDYFVTLNSTSKIREEQIIKVIDYMHPVFDAASLATQSELPILNGRRNTWYCGSYFGFGFHEDAVKSANLVGRDFGMEL